MATYALVPLLCAAWFFAGYMVAMLRRARRERGYATPPAFTLTSRAIGINTERPIAGGSNSTFLLGGQLVARVWPEMLHEPNRPSALTGYGELEGGSRGNGLLPYAGCDD